MEKIIRKWYRTLFISGKYDAEFEKLIDGFQGVCQETFSENAGENLLIALYRCEDLEQKYSEKGISRDILLETLIDIVTWTDIWYDHTGEFGVMETHWLENHLSMKLFRLGRLQYRFGKAEMDEEEIGMQRREPILEIHIPFGEPLLNGECKASIQMAKDFFSCSYPEYVYRFFTCHSWLLDKTMDRFLNPGSNITQFRGLFHVIKDEESDEGLRFIFRRDTNRENLARCEAKSRFAEKVKSHVIAGGKLYASYGVISKE